MKLQIPRVSSLQQPAIRLFGLHGRCRLILTTEWLLDLSSTTHGNSESCRFFLWHPQKKTETNSFQCLSPPNGLDFLFCCRCFVFGPAQTVGVLFCWRKKRPKPIQNDSLREALDRFFCISSFERSNGGKVSGQPQWGCSLRGVPSEFISLKKHTHTNGVLGWVSDCFFWVKQE